jgi:hypothetical protein
MGIFEQQSRAKYMSKIIVYVECFIRMGIWEGLQKFCVGGGRALSVKIWHYFNQRGYFLKVLTILCEGA